MTISLKAAADGLSGTIQVGGVDRMNFGSDTSGQPFSFRNKLINGGFNINQRAYVSGAAVGTNLYGLDRWKMEASTDTFTFSTTANKTTVTIPAGKVLRQVIEGLNLQTGTYTLSWEGTAQGKIGAGSLSASGVTGSITGGTDTTIEFGPGTVANAQLEFGTIPTAFEQRPISVELAMCLRYYEIINIFAKLDAILGAANISAGLSAPFKVVKRATPTLAVINEDNINTSTATFVAPNTLSANAIFEWLNGTAIVGRQYAANWSASAEL